MSPEPLLEISGLTRHFAGLAAVQDLSFDVAEGEFVSLIGPNGAGKTTAFNVITGFLAPTAGDVRFAGDSVVKLAPHRRARSGLIRTFQQAMVFGEATVTDCMRAAQHMRGRGGLREFFSLRRDRAQGEDPERARGRELLDFCGLAAWADTPGLDLPYGVQKTLGIAMALACEPRLLMLDEPTSGLTVGETQQVGRLLEEVNDRGTTVLLVEHHMDVVMGLSDRVVVLDHGVKIAEGGPEDVRADPAVIQAYLGDFQVA